MLQRYHSEWFLAETHSRHEQDYSVLNEGRMSLVAALPRRRLAEADCPARSMARPTSESAVPALCTQTPRERILGGREGNSTASHKTIPGTSWAQTTPSASPSTSPSTPFPIPGSAQNQDGLAFITVRALCGNIPLGEGKYLF